MLKLENEDEQVITKEIEQPKLKEKEDKAPLETREKWVTAYCDASAGSNKGWACWLRHEVEPFRVLAHGKHQFDDSTAAELQAIIHAVRLSINNWPEAKGIGVRSDSQAALGIAKFNAKVPKRKDLARMQKELRKVLGNKFIKCVWVKGHQDGDETQAYLNRWCDKYTR